LNLIVIYKKLYRRKTNNPSNACFLVLAHPPPNYSKLSFLSQLLKSSNDQYRGDKSFLLLCSCISQPSSLLPRLNPAGSRVNIARACALSPNPSSQAIGNVAGIAVCGNSKFQFVVARNSTTVINSGPAIEICIRPSKFLVSLL
jgi:hypothetical protein